MILAGRGLSPTPISLVEPATTTGTFGQQWLEKVVEEQETEETSRLLSRGGAGITPNNMTLLPPASSYSEAAESEQDLTEGKIVPAAEFVAGVYSVPFLLSFPTC